MQLVLSDASTASGVTGAALSCAVEPVCVLRSTASAAMVARSSSAVVSVLCGRLRTRGTRIRQTQNTNTPTAV